MSWCVCMFCESTCNCPWLSVSPGSFLIDQCCMLWRWKGCWELISRYESWVSSVWCEHILITQWKRLSSLIHSLYQFLTLLPISVFPPSCSVSSFFLLLCNLFLSFLPSPSSIVFIPVSFCSCPWAFPSYFFVFLIYLTFYFALLNSEFDLIFNFSYLKYTFLTYLHFLLICLFIFPSFFTLFPIFVCFISPLIISFLPSF